MAASMSSNAGQKHDRIPETDNDLSPDSKSAFTNLNSEISLTQKMLSAVSGSVLTSLLVTPLDVVRVRLQSQPTSPADSRPSPSSFTTRSFSKLPPTLGVTSCCREVFWVNNNSPFCIADSAPANVAYLNPTTPTTSTTAQDCLINQSRQKNFTSTLDGLRKIARHEGLPTLWRGLSPTLVMAVPGNVIYFAGYDWLRTSRLSPLSDPRILSDAYAPLLAGSSARVFAALFVSPIELFRTRMQAAHTSASATGHFRETLAGVRDMVRAQGALTLWRGLTLTLWRDVPFSALYWWGYEAARNVLTDFRQKTLAAAWRSDQPVTRRRAHSRSQQDHATTLVDSFAGGAASGALASVVTTPFDVGKTRQQVYWHAGDGSGVSGGEIPKQGEKSMVRFLWQIGREEGAAGLFRGWIPRVMKVAPACAIMISSYELGKKMAQGVKKTEDHE